MIFDADGPATEEDEGIFALPWSVSEASLVICPVPWDATSSQSRVASAAPEAVLAASMFVELYDPKLGAIYQRRIAMDPIDADLVTLNRSAVEAYASADRPRLAAHCRRLNERVRATVAGHLGDGRRVGLLGGDHSVSYGAVEAQVSEHPGIGILQIDAHCDLRRAFDDVEFSHASVMYNVMETLDVSSLVQVGVRALCEAEARYVESSERVVTFVDADLQSARADGVPWREICTGIVSRLPAEVYVSFDIDGLEPAFCPNTGTPVPGGLSYNEAVSLLHYVRESGRRIVGFDLVEVGNGELDANVAAHLLYQLCGVVGE